MASYRYERDIDPKDLQPRKQQAKEYGLIDEVIAHR